MTDMKFHSSKKPHFFQPLLPGFYHHLDMPVNFFKKNVEGRHEEKTTTLVSDVSDRKWEVKIDGRRFADDWKDFVVDHGFRVGESIFRQEGEGDLGFHVTGFGPSCCNLVYSSSRSDDENGGLEEEEEDYDDSEEEDAIDEKNSGIRLREKRTTKKKKNPPHEPKGNPSTGPNSNKEIRSGECSEEMKFMTLTFTPHEFKRLLTQFTRANNIERPRNITLVDKHRVEWPINLSKEKKTGKMVLGKGLKSFCIANVLKEGESFEMELISRNATPVLKFSSEVNTQNNIWASRFLDRFE
ncbi:PREDICTED: LOW QUALITY PROTEIN: B3 domain-containing protein REM10-like [Tarenaya hassleriana]|uniref:LOW QUALITY PROTEIN: B3 domain-containing protein REM10-like n=1 Tax=Tarenaya hassleriana TaxID=28532 RepID=UPI00053C30D6|nr:PREDICTED: LOW QUALITY PROTEIN: B3 domain-containing protein REM10-like [Tarenaya hassleriana]